MMLLVRGSVALLAPCPAGAALAPSLERPAPQMPVIWRQPGSAAQTGSSHQMYRCTAATRTEVPVGRQFYAVSCPPAELANVRACARPLVFDIRGALAFPPDLGITVPPEARLGLGGGTLADRSPR
jgi:hypothetical protein